MSFHLINPYLTSGFTWLRGNLHAHTTRSDGKLKPQQVIEQYVAAGHDFLAITDHDVQSDYAGLDPQGLILLPGNEVTANAQHLLHIGGATKQEPHADRQQVLDAIASGEGFAVLAHPSWLKEYAYYPHELLLSLRCYLGIEVFNGVIGRLPGSPYALNQWDYLLSRGHHVYGFATDDSHDFGDVALGWNVVQARTADVHGVMEALRAGRFYASTGVAIRSVRTAGRRVGVSTENASKITLVSDHGVRVASQAGREAVFELPEGFAASYVRVECWGKGEQQAWSQPLWVRGPDEAAA